MLIQWLVIYTNHHESFFFNFRNLANGVQHTFRSHGKFTIISRRSVSSGLQITNGSEKVRNGYITACQRLNLLAGLLYHGAARDFLYHASKL